MAVKHRPLSLFQITVLNNDMPIYSSTAAQQPVREAAPVKMPDGRRCMATRQPHLRLWSPHLQHPRPHVHPPGQPRATLSKGLLRACKLPPLGPCCGGRQRVYMAVPLLWGFPLSLFSPSTIKLHSFEHQLSYLIPNFYPSSSTTFTTHPPPSKPNPKPFHKPPQTSKCNSSLLSSLPPWPPSLLPSMCAHQFQSHATPHDTFD